MTCRISFELVLSGANPGAMIDNVAIRHGDGVDEVLDDEAIIYTGLELMHAEGGAQEEQVDDEDEDENEDDDAVEHAEDDEKTLQDVYDSFSDEQKKVVHYMIGAALEAAANNDDDDNDGGEAAQSDNDQTGIIHEEGTEQMNVFEKNAQGSGGEMKHELTADGINEIVTDAKQRGSLKEAVKHYAMAHGIDNIEVLFPDAKSVDDTPEWISRRTEWVAGVLNGTRHTPFSRIKTRNADITHDEARAKGYVKGSLKKEEFFSVSKRTTTPTTVYKKQKLDRDDILDITDFDVVAWLKGEMRLMLDEELARAVLIGDGREVSDEDKIKDPVGATDGAGIRSILNDHELYVTTVNVNIDDADSDYNEVVEAVMRARRFYKGTGTPTLYTTNSTLVEMLLSKDSFGRRRWESKAALATSLMVKDIVEVDVMEDADSNLLGVVVNLTDYVMGADRGGQVSLFDDFDIDYNQYKYLIETRVSGALVKIKSALVIKKVAAADVLTAPTEPTFDGSTITIPTDATAEYSVDGTPVIDGATHAVAVGDEATVTAAPAAGYYFATNAENQWVFRNRG